MTIVTMAYMHTSTIILVPNYRGWVGKYPLSWHHELALENSCAKWHFAPKRSMATTFFPAITKLSFPVPVCGWHHNHTAASVTSQGLGVGRWWSQEHRKNPLSHLDAPAQMPQWLKLRGPSQLSTVLAYAQDSHPLPPSVQNSRQWMISLNQLGPAQTSWGVKHS